MGGHTKTSQRTKNNARPSSSGRSAGLLGAAAAGGAPLFAALALAGEPALPPALALAFKKLNKKDPITKTKALQELTELATGAAGEGQGELGPQEVALALPSWTHHYRTLAQDPDRRVRELTQACHGALMLASGRLAAPHLKRLLPAWLLAAQDEHAPARARAMAALDATFPGPRLAGALAFCRDDALAALRDALKGADASTRGTKADAEADADAAAEAAAAALRRQACALQAMAHLARHVAPTHGPWLREQLTPMLDDKPLWQMHQHSDEHIRCAWYELMGALAEAGPAGEGAEGTSGGALGAHGPRLLRALLARPETGAAAGPRWHALLLLVSRHKDWYDWLDKKELLETRIVNLLESGGWGDARQVWDTVLQLLEVLPTALHCDRFHCRLFDAALQGLESKHVMRSRGERQRWLAGMGRSAAVLCAREQDGDVREEGEEIAMAHVVRRWVEAALGGWGAQHEDLVRQTAAALAQLARHWLLAPPGRHEPALRALWHAMAAPSPAADIAHLRRQALLVSAMHTALDEPPEKRPSVSFQGDPSPAESSPPAPSGCGAGSGAAGERYRHGLRQAAARVAAHWLAAAAAAEGPGGSDDTMAAVGAALAPLLRQLDHPALWTALAAQLGAQGGDARGLALRLTGWLGEGPARPRCEALVPVLALLLGHLPPHHQDDIFRALDQLDDSVVQWVAAWWLERGGWGREERWARWVRWVRSGRAARALLGAAREAARGVEPAARLLGAALHHHQGTCGQEMLVSEETMSAIVDVACAALNGVTARPPEEEGQEVKAEADGEEVVEGEEAPAPLDGAARLAARLALAGAGGASLVDALWRMLVLVPEGDRRLSECARAEAVRAACEGLRALGPDAAAAGLRAAQVLREHFERRAAPVEHAVALASLLAGVGDEAEALARWRQVLAPPAAAAAAATEATGAALRVEASALRADLVQGRLQCPMVDSPAIKLVLAEEEENEEDKEGNGEEELGRALALHLRRVALRAAGVRALVAQSTDSTDTPEPLLGWLAGELAHLLHDRAVLRSLQGYYTYWESERYELLNQSVRLLEGLEAEAEAEVGGLGERVRRALGERAAREGHYWAHAAVEAGVGAEGRLEEGGEGISGDGYFHALQAHCERQGDEAALLSAAWAAAARAARAALGAQGAAAGLAQRAQGADHCEEARTDLLGDLYYAHPSAFAVAAPPDGDDAPPQLAWAAASAGAALARYLARLVAARGWDLPRQHWDLAVLALCSLADAAHRQRASLHRAAPAMLAAGALALLEAVAAFVAGVLAGCERRQPAEHVAALPAEWRDVFAPHLRPTAHALLLAALGGGGGDPAATCNRVCVMRALARPHALALALGEAPERRASLAAAAAGALAEPRGPRPLHALAFLALDALAHPLADDDVSALAAWGALAGEEADEGEAPTRPVLAGALLAPLVRAAVERAAREPLEARRGALLLAEALHRLADAHDDLDRLNHYLEIVKEHDFVPPLVEMALQMLPWGVAAHVHGSAPPAAHAEPFFVDQPHVRVDDRSSEEDVRRLACRALYCALAGVGLGRARGWYGLAAAPQRRALERLVRAWVAPAVARAAAQDARRAAQELNAVNGDSDSQASALSTRGEVALALAVDERRVQLRVALSPLHPLAPPRLQASGGACLDQAPRWLALLATRHPLALRLALLLWARWVLARVDKAPPCYVCYCRLHHATGRLPHSACKQCHNKFHLECIRKWFATSQKANCPMCRGLF